MTTGKHAEAFLNEVEALAKSKDFKVTRPMEGTIAGEAEKVTSKWFLGGRKIVFRFSCETPAADNAVLYREMTKETSWGFPPPTLTVETSTISGMKRTGTHTEKSLGGGGGTLNFAELREAVEAAAQKAGLGFKMELRPPHK